MDIHVTTRHCTITEAENNKAIDTAASFDRYSFEILRVDAIFDLEPLQKVCEFTVKMQGKHLIAREVASDFTKAINDAGEKIHRQLSKIHDRYATNRP